MVHRLVLAAAGGLMCSSLLAEDAATLKGHEKTVTAVVFTPDGQRLVSGAFDGTVRVWDVKTHKELFQFEKSTQGIWALAITADGRHVVVGGTNGVISILSIRERKTLRQIKAHVYEVRVVAADGEEVSRELKRRAILSIACSPDGKMVASGSEDHSVAVWEMETGKKVFRIRKHTRSVDSVAFSPDGKILASGSDDRTIRLSDASTGKHIATLKSSYDWNCGVSSICFSPNGKTLVSSGKMAPIFGDYSLRVWDVAARKELSALWQMGSAAASVAFSPDGELLAAGGMDGEVHLWTRSTPARFNKLKLNESLPDFSTVKCVTFSPNGRLLASAGEDNIVRIWNVGNLLKHSSKE